jgi:hypothetical protein
VLPSPPLLAAPAALPTPVPTAAVHALCSIEVAQTF